ncbi:SIS domain-containing protein [Holdemania massiliensis]|uniref:SIS domain-containing protein n=1 Tax=Holdemania massiliensis TaxID=1468449 RepID=A0A6N7S787_9FIRM|nr:SIS domain-containing protein [Holdemania massiliensis]MSA71494.1 SIS domain-containing protein [Holdemania massiliensis]MSA89743.1 SIS domain-containing protein [Holdemania massiliensis]MSB78574.1 SIS domain-containing protein [Holdemania massiliensis]MSC33498.1 SIS domain-containing protein [Holdemania massiliensis]MSC39889.1 SIS domain-containing protein [Holdemania massiliensis]
MRSMEKEKLSMIGHIQDTPRVLKKAYTLRDEYMNDFVDAFVSHDFKKVYFLGSGTSNHVSMVIKNLFVDLLHVEGVACAPTIFTNHENPNPSGVFKKEQICVIGFSQHGDSISTCEAVKKASEDGYFTIAVTEQLDSALQELADVYCHLVCEEEEIGPETRGYTETIYQFYIQAIEIARRKKLISEAEFHQLDAEAEALADNLEIVVKESVDWYNRNKQEFYQMTKSSIAGYGYNYPTALESRLKFFETYSRPCTGYEMEEQMHGPMRAYNQDNYIFMIASEGQKELNRLKELVPYYKDVFTEHVFVITCEEGVASTDRDLKFSVRTSDLLSPILYVIPFQVLSALICEDTGIDTKVSPIKKRYVSSHYPSSRHKNLSQDPQ